MPVPSLHDFDEIPTEDLDRLPEEMFYPPAPAPPVPEAAWAGEETAGSAAQPATVHHHPSSVFPDWLPHIIPANTINIVAGASGVGKTALTAEWMARWRSSRSICNLPTTLPTGGLGIIVCDRKWSSHKQWFEAVGFPEIPHYSLCDDPKFNPESLNNRLAIDAIFEGCIGKLGLQPGSLIVVDPIAIFISGNLIDYRQTAISLIKLARICVKHGVTLLGTAHMSKQKGKDDRYMRPQDRILGSAAFAGYTDTQMYLLSPEDMGEEYYGFGWIPHNAPSDTFMFTRDTNGLFIPYEMPNKQNDLDAIYQMITEDHSGTKTKEILRAAQEQLSLAQATFYRYLQELKEQGKIEKAGHGSWRRTKAPLQTPPTTA